MASTPKKPDSEALCRELLTIEKRHAAVFARMDEIKSALKTAAGENFKITVKGLGEVSVSAPKPKRMEGAAPELSIEAFLALSKAEQNALIKKGLVGIIEQWKDAYYGSVRTKLF